MLERSTLNRFGLFDRTIHFYKENGNADPAAGIIIATFEQTLINHLFGKSLVLNNLEISKRDIPYLCAFLKKRPDISGLILDGNNIGDDGVSFLVKLTTISRLSLNGCGITCTGASLFTHNQYESLRLNSNKIEDLGARSLANNNLKKVELELNNISDEGAAAFLDTDTQVNLRRTLVSEGMLKKLAGRKPSPTLRR